MQPFFLWNIQYNKDAVEKRTFGSVGETAGTEIGDKRRSEGGAMVKTTGCYVEFHVKNPSCRLDKKLTQKSSPRLGK